ncbi:MAG: N-acetylmuramoyl-L-alanine amidase [Abditibacteriota bacterium]|nr:N-acetylmuramoyl-L-alanine amidase [Abditibacteriota bacterium]
MKKLLFILVLASLAAAAQCGEKFPISLWQAPDTLDDATVKDVADAGFTVYFDYTHKTPAEQKQLLDLCQKYDMKVQVYDERLRDFDWEAEGFAEKIASAVNEYKDHPALWGYHICDEPAQPSFYGITRVSEEIRKNDPNHVAFTNMFPFGITKSAKPLFDYADHERFIEEYMSLVRPDVLSYDIYVLAKDRAHDNLRGFFSNLEIIRSKALKYDVPFCACILDIEHGGYRDPSDDDIRWQIYNTIAYGGQGIIYFTYAPPKQDTMFKWGDALLDWDGNKTRRYYAAKTINHEILAMSDTLMSLKSVAVFNTGKVVSEHTRPIPVENLIGIADGEFVLGQFVSDKGEMYAMVSNKSMTEPQTAVLKFAQDVKVSEVAPHGGRGRQTAANKWEKTLSPGDGVLIKIETAPLRYCKWNYYVKPKPRVVLDPSDQFRNIIWGDNNEELYNEGKNMYEIAELTYKKLKEDGRVDVYLNRDFRDQEVKLSYEAKLGRRIGCDAFVAFHSDANNNTEMGGTWTFFRPTGRDESQRLANCVQYALLDAIRTFYPEAKDRGVKEHWNHLHVVYNSYCPAILTETMFHTNPVEREYLKNKQDKLAEGYARGILKYFGYDY